MDIIKVIELPKFLDERGNLSFVEQGQHIPFKIARSYWIYDVPGGEIRGGHAYKKNEEFIIALSGSFDVLLDDGHEQQFAGCCIGSNEADPPANLQNRAARSNPATGKTPERHDLRRYAVRICKRSLLPPARNTQ